MLASVSLHSKNQPPWPCLKQAELTVSQIPLLMSSSNMLQAKGKLAFQGQGLLEPSKGSRQEIKHPERQCLFL